MPRVNIFYAMKANTDQKLCQEVLDQGLGVDVASESEIVEIIKLGAKPDDLIFANPIKQPSMLQTAKDLGVKKMTFDSVEELHKIKNIFPDAECVLRISSCNTDALYNLSEKFGVFMKDVPEMLQTAKNLNLRVKGVAFHTGSGGVSIEPYLNSLKDARKVFDMAKDMGLPEMDLLDIGGGFTQCLEQEEGKNFDQVAPRIANMIDELFEDEIQVIAEPGRLLSESYSHLVSNIIGTKVINGTRNYYVNTGLYQAYFYPRIYGEPGEFIPVYREVTER